MVLWRLESQRSPLLPAICWAFFSPQSRCKSLIRLSRGRRALSSSCSEPRLIDLSPIYLRPDHLRAWNPRCSLSDPCSLEEPLCACTYARGPAFVYQLLCIDGSSGGDCFPRAGVRGGGLARSLALALFMGHGGQTGRPGPADDPLWLLGRHTGTAGRARARFDWHAWACLTKSLVLLHRRAQQGGLITWP